MFYAIEGSRSAPNNVRSCAYAKLDYGKPDVCGEPCPQTLALDPEYAVKKSRSFVSGGVAGNLILNSKASFLFLSRLVD